MPWALQRGIPTEEQTGFTSAISKVLHHIPVTSKTTRKRREDRIRMTAPRVNCLFISTGEKFYLNVHNQCAADLQLIMRTKGRVRVQILRCLVTAGYRSRRPANVPGWLLIITASACGHASTRTGTISNCLVWYLSLNLRSASIVPQFIGVLSESI